MKSYKFILPVLAFGALATSCDDIETVQEQGHDIVSATTYAELYYQNLREYKETDHEIAFGWFSKYGGEVSMANRFAGLPDSMDLISLWGGIPTNPIDLAEMRECQTKKGIKFMPVDICRINKADNQEAFKQHWLQIKDQEEAGTLTGDALQAAEYEVMREYGLYCVDLVFNNDLDGFDIDFEPEGDPVDGDNFYQLFMEMAKYLGPNPEITKEERYALIEARYGTAVAQKKGSCDKYLCIDAYGQDPSTSTTMDPDNGKYAYADYINYFLSQDYNGMITRSRYPAEKVVHTVSVGEHWSDNPATTSNAVGDYYSKTGLLYTYASYKPASGRKGGFGGFIINDDYTITNLNPYPYARLRDCIQICNPAIY
jgi:hypothetical protein